ncbi:unnamed protein product, partial [Mesorhabditis spiculigera]
MTYEKLVYDEEVRNGKMTMRESAISRAMNVLPVAPLNLGAAPARVAPGDVIKRAAPVARFMPSARPLPPKPLTVEAPVKSAPVSSFGSATSSSAQPSFSNFLAAQPQKVGVPNNSASQEVPKAVSATRGLSMVEKTISPSKSANNNNNCIDGSAPEKSAQMRMKRKENQLKLALKGEEVIVDLSDRDLLSLISFNNDALYLQGNKLLRRPLGQYDAETHVFREENYAHFKDLEQFVSTSLPERATPITFILNSYMLIMGRLDSDKAKSIREHVKATMASTKLRPLRDIGYGKTALYRDDQGLYKRVLLLACQGEDKALICPLDATEKVTDAVLQLVPVATLHRLPSVLSVEQMATSLHLTLLRGLCNFAPGSIGTARRFLQSGIATDVAGREVWPVLVQCNPRPGERAPVVDLLVPGSDGIAPYLASELLYAKNNIEKMQENFEASHDFWVPWSPTQRPNIDEIIATLVGNNEWQVDLGDSSSEWMNENSHPEETSPEISTFSDAEEVSETDKCHALIYDVLAGPVGQRLLNARKNETATSKYFDHLFL